MTVISIQ